VRRSRLPGSFDLQHEHAEEMLVPSPDDPTLRVGATHVIPREAADLLRDRRAFEIVAAKLGRDHGAHPGLPET